MKNLILVFLFLLTGCKTTNQDSPLPQAAPEPAKEVITIYKTDTLFITKVDTVFIIRPSESVLKLQITNDSLKTFNNKLGKELLHNKLIIQNAKYYLNIANKNPSQQKFLRGWMNRALNQ